MSKQQKTWTSLLVGLAVIVGLVSLSQLPAGGAPSAFATPPPSPSTTPTPTPPLTNSLDSEGCMNVHFNVWGAPALLESITFDGSWEHELTNSYWVEVYAQPDGGAEVLLEEGWYEGTDSHSIDFEMDGPAELIPTGGLSIIMRAYDYEGGSLVLEEEDEYDIDDYCSAPPTSQYYECSDDVDNDSDSKIDWDGNGGTADPQCPYWWWPEEDEAEEPPSPSVTESTQLSGCVDVATTQGSGEIDMSVKVNGFWSHNWNGPYWVEVYIDDTLVHEGTHSGEGSHEVFLNTYASTHATEGYELVVKRFDEQGGTQVGENDYTIEINDYCSTPQVNDVSEWECLDLFDNDGDNKIDVGGIDGTPPIEADPECEYFWSSEWKIADDNEYACDDVYINGFTAAEPTYDYFEGDYLANGLQFGWRHAWEEEEGYYVRGWAIATEALYSPPTVAVDPFDPEDLEDALGALQAEYVIGSETEGEWHEGDEPLEWTPAWTPPYPAQKKFRWYYEDGFEWAALIRLYQHHDDDVNDFICEYTASHTFANPE